jgi:hypothetical protein
MVADELSSSSSPTDGDDDGDGTGSAAAHAWKGTYLYMSPEATGMNAEKGYPKGRIATKREEPLFGASDSFSFGVMLLIMMTRDARWFETDGLQLPSIIGKDGKPHEDMRTVATWYFNGKRPQFEASFPPLLRLLIEGCWGDKQSDRLRFSEIEALLLLQLGTIDWLHVDAAAPVVSFDEWLADVGIEGSKDELYEYDVREGKAPLEKLVELMTEEGEDFAEMLDDLFADDGAMQTFRTAVEQLAKPTAAGTDGSDTGGGEHDKDKTARETLLAMLPASEQEVRIAELEDSVVELHGKLQSVVAQKD